MDNTTPFSRNGQLYLALDLPIEFDFSPECYAMLQLLYNLDYSKFEEKQSKLGRPNAASAKVMGYLIIYKKHNIKSFIEPAIMNKTKKEKTKMILVEEVI